MTSRRLARIARAVKETVSTTVLFELKDPRVQNVTVTGVDVSPDIRSAKVYVSIMGTEQEQALCMKGLRSARGYVQSKVANRLQTRNTPVLRFEIDHGVKKSIEASRILREVLGEERSSEADATAGEEGTDSASASDESGPAPPDSEPS